MRTPGIPGMRPDHRAFLRASIVFLVAMTVLVIGYAHLDLYIFGAYLMLIAIAVLGFYLGFASRSTWSIWVIPLTLLILQLIDPALPQGPVRDGEYYFDPSPDYWASLIILVPTWVTGRFLGYSSRDRVNDSRA